MGTDAAAMDHSRPGLAELYRRHADDAVKLAYLLTGSRETAEDLVQEAFVRTARRFVDLRHPDAFGSYLRTVVVNLARSHWRRRRLEQDYVARERGLARRRDDGPDLAARDELWQALARLTQRQRTAIVLRYYEDMSEQQAAAAMGCSTGALKSLVNRGMETLRKALGREDDA